MATVLLTATVTALLSAHPLLQAAVPPIATIMAPFAAAVSLQATVLLTVIKTALFLVHLRVQAAVPPTVTAAVNSLVRLQVGESL